MLQRCYNPKNWKYPDYGARGIVVCERWKNDFHAFAEDLGPKPSKDHSIDRIDNSGNYEPGNVRYATRSEQARNKRNTIMLTYNGETRTLHDWAEKIGVSSYTIHMRRWLGKSVEEMLAPVKKKEKNGNKRDEKRQGGGT